MKIGLKVWTPEQAVEMIEKCRPDFIETMAIESETYNKLKNYDIPFTIHMEHMKFGVNLADPNKKDRNKLAMGFAIDTADMLDAKTIVVHLGFLDNKNCNLDVAMEFLNGFDDKRIVFENMPYYPLVGVKKTELCSNLTDIRKAIENTNKGFCLDFGHAAAGAYGLGIDYMKMVRDLMKLKPRYFHFHDSLIKVTTDKHLHLGGGELDIQAFKSMLPKDAWVALETPMDIKGRINDIKFMKR